MATGTQMVLGVKKIIKIIVPSGLHLDKNKTVVSSCGLFAYIFYFKNLDFLGYDNFQSSNSSSVISSL